MYWIFVKLKTDDGIEGVGEIYSATFGPKAMAPIIDDVFERHLLNRDPHHVERLFRQAYSSGFTQRPDLTMMGVVSGLEMACWDIIGKAAGKPRGLNCSAARSTSGCARTRTCTRKNTKGEYDYDDPDLAAECAAENNEARLHGRQSSIRPARTRLTRATSCRWKCSTAASCSADACAKPSAARPTCCSARTGRWCRRRRSGSRSGSRNTTRCGSRSRFPGQEEAIAQVAKHTSIPIATGERLTTKYEFHKLLQAGGASILQLNVARVGGLLEAKKIATLAVHYTESRRTCTTGRWARPRASSSRPARRTS